MDVHGTITEFDGERGLGELRTDEGVAFGFHCVSIADGSRSIEVGARARGLRHVGLLGQDDLVDVAAV